MFNALLAGIGIAVLVSAFVWFVISYLELVGDVKEIKQMLRNKK